jgi:hypothetical protein
MNEVKMYDQQLWYWPAMDAVLVLTLYLDGSSRIESEDIEEQAIIDLMNECLEQAMDIDEYLDVKGIAFLDHLPL